jgi:hypothetical protein
MKRWGLIGYLLKRAAQLLALGVLLLMFGAWVVDVARVLENWPERLPQFLERQFDIGPDFGARRMLAQRGER